MVNHSIYLEWISRDDTMNATNNQKSYNLYAYLFVLFGQIQSHLGSNVVQFVIIFWIALKTNSPFILGLAAFSGFAPMVFLTPFAGVLVDRWSRKKIIVSMDFMQAVITVVLVYLFWIGEFAIWQVLVVLALRSIFEAFHMPATEAIVPLLVPPKNLSRINGLTFLMQGLIGVIGPVLAVFLLNYWEIYEILLIDPLTSIIAVISVLLINIPSVKKNQSDEEKLSFKTEFSEGITVIKKKDGLLALLLTFTTSNLLMQPLFTLLPLFVIQVHFGGSEDLAFLLALNQVGVLFGSLIMSVWKGFKRKVIGVVLGHLFSYLGMIIIALTQPADPNAFLIMGAAMVAIGILIAVVNVCSQTIWLSVVSPDKMGRVMSVRTTIAWFVIPIAMILSGILAEISEMRSLFFVCAVVGLLCLAYLWFRTSLPNIEKSPLSVEEVVVPAVEVSH
ncbi:MAG: MFS transporter [Promethearchaeota archaeon]